MLNKFNWGQISGIFAGLCGNAIADGEILLAMLFGTIILLIIILKGI